MSIFESRLAKRIENRLSQNGNHRGFPFLSANDMIAAGKEPAMDPESTTPETDDWSTDEQPEAPRLSHWLWRPWYAKLWWKAAALFWVAFILEEVFVPRSLSQALFEQFEGWLVTVLILFHPFLILPVLSIGWLWAMSGQPRGESGGHIYDRTTEFGFNGRNTDPTNPADPRYIWHPANPQSQAWRDTHVFGRH
ncbi:hypothetical protein K3M67_06180 [Sphingobium sp. V4]|uniref:hypothetical protein n=1 Tax=Sphingobium sp. V4 TaxID=3038927 RepID=UPI002557D4BC|nr:hypothetical protein [Sphingobium sp. V4]WIW89546.1 hypothetical protein K3M67_06180 [Sphingobium sp. V4]